LGRTGASVGRAPKQAAATAYTGSMCGRIVRIRDDYGDLFGVRDLSETRVRHDALSWLDRFNIAPTETDVIIRPAAEGRDLVASRWGLVPRWQKDRRFPRSTFNARAETLAEKPMFRPLIKGHRCIVPASGFYEWRREGSAKQPYYIHRGDERPIALAGLWSEWTDPESGEQLTSHTVITCAPNTAMAPIHDRMPVILDAEGLDAWLDPHVKSAADVLPLLGPCPADWLAIYPVSAQVNDARADGPDLIRPLAE
jgi:putative SOS response-associated peptidase YedK